VTTTTAAQNTFWRKLRQHVDGLPEHFTPGKYRCPAHDDKGRSLKVDYRDNAVKLHCFSSNCSGQAVMDRLGHRWGDMSDYGPQVGGKLLGTFTYADERGAETLRAYRYTDPAGVRYQHFTPDGWVFGAAARGPHLLYRLPEVRAAIEAEERVFVVDDERDADRLREHGVVATTAAYRPPGKPWRRDYTEQLHGAYVTVVARKNEAGRKHARTLASLLLDAGAADVQVVEPATAKPGGGVVEHFAAGFQVEHFATLSGVVEHSATASGVVEGSSVAAIPVALEAGADLLADVEQFLRRYVCFSSPAQAAAAALWVAHTWAAEAFDFTPYLHVTAPEKRSGKSRVLDAAGALCRRPLKTAHMSAAAVYRSIGDPLPTIMFDEVQELFSRTADPDAKKLRAVLQAGFETGTPARLVEGEGSNRTVVEYPVFCPKALAGTGELPDMLADRSVSIRLKRKPRDARVDRFRRRLVEQDAGPLRARLAGWAKTARDVLAEARPELPDELNDRQQDIWEPLLSVAAAAGGDWPATARAAAVELSGGEVVDESVGVLLLRHIRETFEQHGALERISTAQLLGFLVERDDGPWGDWWGADVDTSRLKGPAVRLANLLKPYGVKPKQLKFDQAKERGYERAAFTEPWALYCAEDGTDGTAQVRGHIQHGTEVEPVPTPKPPLTSKVPSVPSESAEGGRRGTAAPADVAARCPACGLAAEYDPGSEYGRQALAEGHCGQPWETGRVYPDTAAWAAAGRPGLQQTTG
jgi:hypothetical protein